MFSLLFTAFLFPKFVKGGRFVPLTVDIFNNVFPFDCSTISLIVSIFSSGIDSKVVLFIVCILRIYQISPSGTLFVVIVIISPDTFHVPMSSGVSISLCPVVEFFVTLICSSFCFIVFGLMAISPVLLILPSLLGITFGFTLFPLIVVIISSVFPII